MRCHARPFQTRHIFDRLRVLLLLVAGVLLSWQCVRDVPGFQRTTLVVAVELPLILAEKPRLFRAHEKMRADPPGPLADLAANSEWRIPFAVGRVRAGLIADQAPEKAVFLRPEARAPPRLLKLS